MSEEQVANPLDHKGEFEIDLETLEGNIEAVFAVMQTVIVIRCEYIFSRRAFVYEAICPEFEAVPEGQATPRYEAELNQGEDDSYTVSWAKSE